MERFSPRRRNGEDNMSLQLSKSQFIRGLQCHKSLWLYKHKPELRREPDAGQQALFDSGTEVGILAQQLFPGGESIEYAWDKIQSNIKRTSDLIIAGVTTIYEATLRFNDVLVMIDILYKGGSGWEIYEVKASTAVKAVHENDVAIQYYVASGFGLRVSKAALVHIDNSYTRVGALDIQALFQIEDLTDITVSRQPDIPTLLADLRRMVKGGEPEIDIGPHCFDPYECDFMPYCWRDVPGYSIFDLSGLKKEQKFSLYNRGVLEFKDIPADFTLSYSQQVQVEAELTRKEHINRDNIKTFLDAIIEPVGFLDFETFMEAIPAFDYQRPYQQIPFQYSLHIVDRGRIKHHEFLGEPGQDPRRQFASRLLEDTAGCKTILVYNQSFELTRLSELQDCFPEYSPVLRSIADRIIDLMKPFQAKDYYVKEMRGSYSIKNVLPALVPELTYDNLAISDGSLAMIAYARLQKLSDGPEKEKLRTDLLEYCKMDTLAMLKILEKLKEIRISA
jgi:hypothetical protein